MPTGYTADIAKGITFKEYAMGCARAFGALVMMRDEPQDAEIPEKFEVSNYHKENIEKLKLELKELSSLSQLVAEEKAKESYKKHIDYHTEQIAKNKELEGKYKAMLVDVESYMSPSPDHDNFKQFMADQINESIKFDCGGDYHYKQLESVKLLSGEEWILSEQNRIKGSIEYHNKYFQEDLDRTNQRNEWVKKLRDSLDKQTA